MVAVSFGKKLSCSESPKKLRLVSLEKNGAFFWVGTAADLLSALFIQVGVGQTANIIYYEKMTFYNKVADLASVPISERREYRRSVGYRACCIHAFCPGVSEQSLRRVNLLFLSTGFCFSSLTHFLIARPCFSTYRLTSTACCIGRLYGSFQREQSTAS